MISKKCFKLMNNPDFGNTMENMRKNRDMKLVTNEARRNYLISKLSYKKFFFKKFISFRNEKKLQIFINKLVYIGL